MFSGFGLYSSETDNHEGHNKIDSIYNLLDERAVFYSDFDSLMPYLNRMKEIAMLYEMPDKLLEVNYLFVRFLDHYNRISEAEKYLNRSFRIYESYRDTFVHFLDRDNHHISMLYKTAARHYHQTGNIERSQELIHKIININRSGDKIDSSFFFNMYITMAMNYRQTGLFDKSYNSYMLAANYLPENEDSILYHTLYHSHLGAFYCWLKDYEKARPFYIDVIHTIEKRRKISLWNQYLHKSYNILGGIIYKELNNKDSAMFYLNKSLQAGRNDPDIMQEVYFYYGDVFLHFLEYDSALLYYNKCFSIIKKNGLSDTYYRSKIIRKLALVNAKMHRYPEALKLINQGMRLLTDDPELIAEDEFCNPSFNRNLSGKSMVEMLTVKGDILSGWYNYSSNKDSGLLKHALKTYRLASEYLDLLRFSVETHDVKEFFAETGKELHENAMKALIQLYKHEKSAEVLKSAYYIIEKSKSRILYEAVRNAGIQDFRSVPDDVLKEENRLKASVSYLNEQLTDMKGRSDSKPDNIKKMEVELAGSRQEYTFFIDSLKMNYPEYYDLKYNTDIMALEEVQQKLVSPNTAVLDYFVSDSMMAVLAITRKNIVFSAIPAGDPAFDGFSDDLIALLKFMSAKNVFENEYNKMQYQSFLRSANALYQSLIMPVTDQLAGERINNLVIIPDGVLGYLPFELLIRYMPDNMETVDYQSPDYLLRDYTIRYENAISLMGEDKKTRDKPLRKYRHTYFGFAPVYPSSSHAYSRDEEDAGSNILRGGFEGLQYNKDEIDIFSGYFKGRQFAGNAASEHNFKLQCQGSGIIHLAAHAFVNHEKPEYSGIVFSDFSKADSLSPEDGILYVHEIYNLNINSELAILSACETGVGKLARGEGIISLARSFKYAGCGNIVMSLWKANDQTTSEIMRQFGKNLKRGMRKNKALQKAKLHYLDNSTKTHPFHWAAFVLIGNEKPLTRGIRSVRVIIPAVLILILLSLFTGFIINRKKK